MFDAEWQVHDGQMQKRNKYEHDNINCTWGKHDKQMRMTFSHHWGMRKNENDNFTWSENDMKQEKKHEKQNEKMKNNSLVRTQSVAVRFS